MLSRKSAGGTRKRHVTPGVVRYKFVTGSRMTGDPQKVGEALAEIASRHGGQLTERGILEAARDPGSHLHDYFEWDDKKAAAKWREQQLAAWQPRRDERN